MKKLEKWMAVLSVLCILKKPFKVLLAFSALFVGAAGVKGWQWHRQAYPRGACGIGVIGTKEELKSRSVPDILAFELLRQSRMHVPKDLFHRLALFFAERMTFVRLSFIFFKRNLLKKPEGKVGLR